MNAFLDFEILNLSDYIIEPNIDIRAKYFPKNLRTSGDTLNQDFSDHENCLPIYRAYATIFEKTTQSETNFETKNSNIKELIERKIDKTINSISENKIKENIQNIIISENNTSENNTSENNIIENNTSENNIIENNTSEIKENINIIESNLRFISDSTNIQNIINQKINESRNVDIQTIIEFEKKIYGGDESKKPITKNDLSQIQQKIEKENKNNTEMLKNKINEQKKFIEDFLNS
jgi:hypothetical protein